MIFKKYRIIFILFLSFTLLLTSCIITKTPGFYSGYKSLTDSQKREIVFIDSNVQLSQSNIPNNKLLAITGKQLKELMSGNDTSVVYKWSPHCSAESCLPLSSVYDYCEKKNYKLYIILEYFSDFEMSQSQFSERYNIFAINQFYYKTDYSPKINNRFIMQLTNGQQKSKDQSWFRYYMFKGNQYLGSVQKLF